MKSKKYDIFVACMVKGSGVGEGKRGRGWGKRTYPFAFVLVFLPPSPSTFFACQESKIFLHSKYGISF